MAELTNGERLIAGRLLDTAENLFSQRSCNDTYPELFAGVGANELQSMLDKINGEGDEPMTLEQVPDFLWMAYLSKRLLAVD